MSPQPFCAPPMREEGSEGSQNGKVERQESDVLESEGRPVSGQRLGEETEKLFSCPRAALWVDWRKFNKLDQSFFEGLVCDEPIRVERIVFVTSTFLNIVDTVSVAHEVDRFSGVLAPLLSDLSSSDDTGWWWLDCGAAITLCRSRVLSVGHSSSWGKTCWAWRPGKSGGLIAQLVRAYG